ncbi:MAG: T9SS type A sorting domain-containing protein [Dehalococcoidales bacterium]|nr:T9SS type A sorting domain-containing protein [Dehalococcoidales bacterium]
MKKSLFLIALLPVFLLATTFHTISIDGNNDFTTNDEEFSTSSSPNYTAYITWDESNLYFGMNGSDIYWTDGGSEKVIFFYIDTDPQITPTSGTGSTSSIEWGITNTLPFTANYAFWWKKQTWHWALRPYSGSSWGDDTHSDEAGMVDRNSIVEFKIPLSYLGNPTQVYILMYFQDSDNGASNWVWANVPSTNSGGQGGQILSHYYSFSLIDSESPNDVNNYDTPLPITLASFSAAALNGCVSVTWVTESESENAHFLLYRDGEVIAQIAGAGTSSEPHSYAYTDRYVVPGRTYTYQLADVSFDGEEVKHNELEVKVEGEYVDRDYSIGAAYPNPFNPLTVVPLNLAKDAVVTATLYDLAGRPLTELHNGSLSAGSHAITINGTNLSTGIYFVHVRVNDATHVQKIALMK